MYDANESATNAVTPPTPASMGTRWLSSSSSEDSTTSEGAVGVPDGVAVGVPDGVCVGVPDGVPDGVCVGVPDGTTVGVPDG